MGVVESVSGCGPWLLLEVIFYSFIGVRVVGRWLELRGGRFSEVRNVLVLWKMQSGASILATLRRVVASQRGR